MMFWKLQKYARKHYNEEDRDDTVVQDLKSMFFYSLTSKVQTEFPSQWFLTMSPRLEEKCSSSITSINITKGQSNEGQSKLSLLCCCSVAKSCSTLCDPMACSTPGFSLLHRLLGFAQTHVLCVGHAIRPSHPLLPAPPFAFHFSQHQDLSQLVSFLHQVAKVLGL